MTEAEAMNIKNGLDLLESKMLDQINKVPPLADNADQMRKYFKDKRVEINNQVKLFNSLLKKD
jgi:hypothetical protein